MIIDFISVDGEAHFMVAINGAVYRRPIKNSERQWLAKLTAKQVKWIASTSNQNERSRPAFSLRKLGAWFTERSSAAISRLTSPLTRPWQE